MPPRLCYRLPASATTLQVESSNLPGLLQRITKLMPFGGFAAETAGALTLFGTAQFGIPVSTTHTITGAIVGVGASRPLSAVRWGVTRRIAWAWVLTAPGAAFIGAGLFHVLQLFLQ